jgi:hypothetical protein
MLFVLMEHVGGQTEESGSECGRPAIDDERGQQKQQKAGKEAAINPIDDESMEHGTSKEN